MLKRFSDGLRFPLNFSEFYNCIKKIKMSNLGTQAVQIDLQNEGQRRVTNPIHTAFTSSVVSFQTEGEKIKALQERIQEIENKAKETVSPGRWKGGSGGEGSVGHCPARRSVVSLGGEEAGGGGEPDRRMVEEGASESGRLVEG